MTTDERLEKMEAQLARTKWLNRCLVAGIVLSLALWALTQTFGPETAWAQSGKKEIRATSFILEDENGKVCAVLGYLAGQGPMLTLMDKNDDVRVALGLKSDGPDLELIGDNHQVRAQLMADKEETNLVLNDDNNAVRFTLTVAKDGSGLSLSHENSNTCAVLSVAKDVSGLGLRDRNGNERVKLLLSPGQCGLQLMDEKGKIWKAP